MDVYGMSAGGSLAGINGESLAAGRLPMRLGEGFITDGAVRQGYAGLSETEKEHLIMRCRDAESRDEMQKVVDELVPGTDISAILAEEKEGRPRQGTRTNRRLW